LSKRRNSRAYAPHLEVVDNTTANNTISFNSYSHYKKSVNLIPKSLKQEEYINLLTDPQRTIVFATGPAGTGKTMLAVMAAVRAYKAGEINKIVITRPAVGVDDEKHGFLPGDLNAKMEPWTRPIMDVIMEYYSPKDILRMLDEQHLELAPLAFQRGRTFKDTWIIFDESQNSSVNQMKMMLTRLGNNSKIVVTGDLLQTDRQFANESGLIDFIERISNANSKLIGYVSFKGKDVQRSESVREVLKLYGEE
jgi:phosphate starvation-inducible PhoH-like protein